MPFSGSPAVFAVVYNWTTESGASPIEIAKLDTQHADFATGLSNCILRDGTGLPTAAIDFNSQNLTNAGAVTAARFIVTGGTVPANGLYLSAANTVAVASNTTLRASVNSTGNWVFAAASSGDTLSVAPGSTLKVIGASDGTRSSGWYQLTTGMSFGSISNHPATLFSNNTDRIVIAAAGNVTINAPSSGVSLVVNNSATGGDIARFIGNTHGHYFYADATDLLWGDVASGGASFDGVVLTPGSRRLRLYTNGSARLDANISGNITINAPSSGVSLAVTAPAAGAAVSLTDGTVSGTMNFGGTVLQIGTTSAHSVQIATNNNARITANSTGNVTIAAPSSGVGLTIAGGGLTVTGGITGALTGNASTATALATPRTINGTSFDGTANITVTAAASTLTGTTLAAGVTGSSLTSVAAGCTVGGVEIGFRGIPQNSQSGNYTLVIGDAGGQILHPSGGGAGDTFTIPANASVAYPIGTVLTFVNLDSNAVSIAITTDTMTIAGTSTTGTRTLGTNGYATAVKVTSTSWLITGVGLS